MATTTKNIDEVINRGWLQVQSPWDPNQWWRVQRAGDTQHLGPGTFSIPFTAGYRSRAQLSGPRASEHRMKGVLTEKDFDPRTGRLASARFRRKPHPVALEA